MYGFLFVGSTAFVEFVTENLDGDISDCGLTDDEDLDPTFAVDERNDFASSPSSDDDEVADNEENAGDQEQVQEVEKPATPSRRLFWKKSMEFYPLPPAPEPEEVEAQAFNFPPIEYVSKYIPVDIFKMLSDFTNQRYLYETGKILKCSIQEMKIFIGVTIIMSYLKFPRIRMYWEQNTRVPIIANNISRDRYFLLRKNLKLQDDETVPLQEKLTNKFWKVQPIIKSVQNGCRLNVRPKSVSIDEQMIPFWGRVSGRQYVKGKPNPCGLKNFVVTAVDGLPLDFFIYQGKGDTIYEGEYSDQLDIGGKAVIKLCDTLPPGVTIYMDRYFTSIPLLELLHFVAQAQGTGTLMKNRIPSNCQLKSNEFKKERRGTIDQRVRSDGQIAIVQWNDNKPVTLASSKDGATPTDQCRRWSKKDGQFIMVTRPNTVKCYNMSMGGIDFLDRVISYYRISARTRKWTVRLIMHMIDFAVAASWIEYRRDQTALKTAKKDVLDYLDFRCSVAQDLIHNELEYSTDSDFEIDPRPAERHRGSVPQPPDSLRRKGNLHLPEFPSPVTKNRCRFPGCSANKARIRCSTCKVFLCLQDNRNCFKLYHEL